MGFSTLVAIVPVFLVAALPAFASIPLLTPKPVSVGVAACADWANKQDEDTLYMWGMREGRNSSRTEAIHRLTASCLSLPTADIVGWNSSVGFNNRYCKLHASAAICVEYAKVNVQTSNNEISPQKIKFRKPLKLTVNWPTSGLWVSSDSNCEEAGDSDGGLLVKDKFFIWHEWGCETKNVQKSTEGRYMISMICSGEGSEGKEVYRLVMISAHFMAIHQVSSRIDGEVSKPNDMWNMWKYCGIPPQDYFP